MQTQYQDINSMVSDVQSVAARNVDLVMDTSELRFASEGNFPVLHSQSQPPVTVNRHALKQVAAHCRIPTRYADRMISEAPELAAINVNHWLHEAPSRRMLRLQTINPADNGGYAATVRAYLSDRYRRIDHDLVLAGVREAFEILGRSGALAIRSLSFRPDSLQLNVSFPELRGEPKVGDVVEAGIRIRNSEIGLSSVDLTQFVYRLVCTNGMTTTGFGDRFRRRHSGGRLDTDNTGNIVLSAEAMAADDEAMRLAIRDAVVQMSDREAFNDFVASMSKTTRTRPMDNVVKAAEVLAETYKLTDKERDAWIVSVVADGDLTQYGAAQGVTALANQPSIADMRRADELHAIGGRLIGMPEHTWEAVSLAA